MFPFTQASHFFRTMEQMPRICWLLPREDCTLPVKTFDGVHGARVPAAALETQHDDPQVSSSSL